MNPFVILPLHDRGELVADCLDSLLSRAGCKVDLAVVADDPDFDPTPYAVGLHFVRGRYGSPTAARNAAMGLRRKGQDLVWVDSDITFQTDGWLKGLRKTLYSDHFGAVSPVVVNLDGAKGFHNIPPNTGIHEFPNIPVGCRIVRAEVADALGSQRDYGGYGCEDLDYDARIAALGYRLAYDSSVLVLHPGVPSDDTWKRKRLEECLPCLKRWEQHYVQNDYLYQDPFKPFYFDIPRLSPRSTEDNYGSHLPHLVDAVKAFGGPVLELGAGMFSTPTLAHLDVESYTVETQGKWFNWAKSWFDGPRHRVIMRGEPWPAEHFGVVLIDHEPNMRVRDIRELRGRTGAFVIHDTEPVDDDIYDWGEVWSDFANHRHFDEVPRTTVCTDLPFPPFPPGRA